ncbi:MAG TPA: beta-propeller fold lactonase family protein [Rhodoferax sp.]
MHAAVHPFTDPTSALVAPAKHGTGQVWRWVLAWFAACIVFSLGLSACGGNDAPTSATASIGAAGGTLTGPDGVQVVVPAGALTQATTISIARSATGAPTTTTVANQAGTIYEFLPHGLLFNKPVTIRMPVPSGALGTNILMASPGEDWQLSDATVVNGMAEWQRNSLSWGTVPFLCGIPVGSTDPYPCSYPQGYAVASATPATAITRVAAGNYNNSAGSWEVNAANTVSLTLNYHAAPDCSSPSIKLIHWDPSVPIGTPGRVQIVREQHVSLTTVPVTYPAGVWSSGGGVTARGEGSTTIDVTSYLTGKAGTHAFGFNFSCQRPAHPVSGGGDIVTLIVNSMASPSATFTIGGTVSGLTGTGLVLQNNGGDNNSVAADGTFSFATAVAPGAAYAVMVQTQPTGQTCSVTNGSGTASANVANVGVSCVASLGSSFIIGSADPANKGAVDLQNNGTDTITVRPDFSFQFPTKIADGATYNVTVLTPPAGQTCTVQNASGTAPQAGGKPVIVVCVDLISGPLALVANSGSVNGVNGLSVYRVNATTGALSLLGNANTGNFPVAVAVSPNGLYAYVTNLVGGSLSSFSIDNAAGTLSSIPLGSPGTSSPYGIAVDPLGRFLWVAGYNASNTVSAFTIGANGAPTASGLPLPTSSYVRVVGVHPSGNFVYVASETTTHDIKVYSVNASDGTLTLVSGTLSAEVLTPFSMSFDPSGNFLYVADYSGDVVAFTVNGGTGALTSPHYYGNVPTHPTSVAVLPNGNYLYVVGSGSQDIGIFYIHPGTNTLDSIGGGTATTGSSPQSITIDSSGSYLYVTNGADNTVSTFSINATSGALTEVGTAKATGAAPVGIAIAP